MLRVYIAPPGLPLTRLIAESSLYCCSDDSTEIVKVVSVQAEAGSIDSVLLVVDTVEAD